MRDPTAQTEPLTIGQRIVAGFETDLISEPCEYAQAIDDAIAAEREACLRIVEPTAPRPCSCTSCDCGNFDDAARVAVWDAEKALADSIRARNS